MYMIHCEGYTIQWRFLYLFIQFCCAVCVCLVVLDIVHKLLPLGESSYWLTKVELLQTLGCIDFTILSLFDKNVAEVILKHVVFKLIGDGDYRYVVYLLL